MANKVIFEIIATAKGVKVVQKQTDELARSTDKATKSTDRLGKSRDNYNRREKGAAQISSNSTKNFSKMQQGIDGGGGSGGLVRAYALLAANVFALTAAFGVLSRSAQIDTLNQSMEILSTTGGTYIKNLAKDMQEASGFAIDLAQSFRQVSLASSAGLNTKEIEGLTAVAKGAAISLGRNLPDAMDRIFRGAIKLEPEILDEIGLFVRVDEAAQKYARNNGKVASSLTQVEKRQAFLNEILEQGTRKFQEYAEEVKPDAFVRIGAALGDIAQDGLSLVNSVLGPTLGFLAESKTLLTITFGVLVASLLKRAIPAMGLMTKGTAELAANRAEDAREYAKSIADNADLALKKSKEENRALAENARLKTKSAMVESGVGGEKHAALMTKKLQNDEIQGQDRINLLVQRESDLLKGVNKTKGDKKIAYNAELALLRTEIKLEEESLRLEKQSATVAKGSLADRRQKALDSKARVSGVVAGAAGTMETQGLTAGWKQLNEQLQIGEEQADGTFRAFTSGEKRTAKLKTGVAGLGVGFNKLMMMMGPVMMALSILGPLAMAIGKALGFANTESKAFSESLEKLEDNLENLNKRLGKQVEGMNNLNLTFLENTKAALAFSKSIVDTSQRTLDAAEALKEWEESAKWLPKLWDRIMGGKKANELLELTQKNFKEIVSFNAQAGNTDLIQKILGVSPETAAAIADIEGLTGELKNTLQMGDGGFSDINGMDMSLRAIVDTVNKFDGKPIEDFGLGTLPGVFKNMTDVERSVYDMAMSLNESNKAAGGVGLTQEQLNQKIKEFNQDATKTETQMENLTSAFQGGAEAVGKFQNQFLPKTKVDDILGSLSAMEASVDALTDPTKIADFYKSFADQDNPFGVLFTQYKEENNAFIMEMAKNARGMPDILDQAFSELDSIDEDTFKQVIAFFEEYKQSVLVTAAETKRLKFENNGLTEGLAAGGKIRTKVNENLNKILKNNTKIAKDTLELQGAGYGLEKDNVKATTQKYLKRVQEADTTEKIKKLNEELSVINLDTTKILALGAGLHELTTKELEEQIHQQTETERLEIQRLTTLRAVVNAQKELNAQKSKEVMLNAQMLALTSSGRTALNPREEAKVKIEQAIFSFDIAKREAEIKKSMIDAEAKLLEMRLFVLAKETEDKSLLNADESGLNATMKASLNEASGLLKDAADIQITNAAKSLTVTISKAISKGFSGGMQVGIKSSQEAYVQGLAKLNELKDPNDASKGTIGTEKEKTDLAQAVGMQMMRESANALSDSLKELGPEGAAVASVVQGALVMSDAYANVGAVFKKNGEGMETNAAIASAVASSIGAISSMMAANSKAQIAEIDGQIDAEKRRDGKSKESLAKIASMEKRKEQMARKAFEQNKKMQIAQTVAATAASVMQIMANPMDPTKMWAAMMIPMTLALGAAQIALIAKTKFNGGGAQVGSAPQTALSVGKRNNSVDVSRGASGGELSYLRGGRGTGSGANNYTPGGAMGRKGYAAGGEGILVGERGPEIVTPSQPVDVIPNDRLSGSTNVNFSINAVDAAGVEDLLVNQRGNIIRMIREAANENGEDFLTQVDPMAYGSNS
jgi:hypothetical protein